MELSLDEFEKHLKSDAGLADDRIAFLC